jgi:hypothetical protein
VTSENARFIGDVAGTIVGASFSGGEVVPIRQEMALEEAFRVDYVEVKLGGKVIASWDRPGAVSTGAFREVILGPEVYGTSSVVLFPDVLDYVLYTSRWSDIGIKRRVFSGVLYRD